MKVILAADHAGFEAKEALKKALLEKGYEVEDKGAYALAPDDDYPDFISLAAEPVAADPQNVAIVFGGSGQGEAMVANRFPSVRAAVYYGGSKEILKLSREHNDANVLSFAARFMDVQDIIDSALLWLETPFSGDERHMRRIRKIDEY